MLSISARFVHRVTAKAVRDDIFFLSGAIAFTLVMAMVPLMVLAVGITGYVLQSSFTNPPSQVAAFLDRMLPGDSIDPELVASVVDFVTRTLDARTGFSVVGAILLILVSTRLSATLRSVLRVVYDVDVRRGLFRGVLFDTRLVLISGLLILANLGVVVGVTGRGLAELVLGYPLTVATLWALFAIVYRTAAPVRPPWKAVFTSATIASIGFEAMRIAFRWYFTDMATLRTTSGGIIALLVLLLFLYYAAIVFVLAAEIGYLVTHPEVGEVDMESPLPEPLEPETSESAGLGQATESPASGPVGSTAPAAAPSDREPDRSEPAAREGAADPAGILTDPRGV